MKLRDLKENEGVQNKNSLQEGGENRGMLTE